MIPMNHDNDDDNAATTALVAARASTWPNLSVNPIYQDFIEHLEDDYVRVLIHLVGVVSTVAPTTTVPLGKRRNRFGRPRIIDAVADPYVIVALDDPAGSGGSSGGSSTNYFNIASFTFPTISNCQSPVWDSKCLLIGKKDAVRKGGLTFKVMDQNDPHNRGGKDEVLMTIHVPGEELPDITPVSTSQWKTFTKQTSSSSSSQRTEHAALEFSIMVTDPKDRIVSAADMKAMYQQHAHSTPTSKNSNHDGYVYSERILRDPHEECKEESGHAVVQTWKHVDSTKAVLWVLGRNDCFMHPHVAQKLFWSQGYDLYVLNYKMNGQCRQKGFVKDPHFNSHNFTGNFDSYIPDIQQSLELIEAEDYELVLGYAHSTGGPVLLNYLMEKGDDAFDGFLFNSPFLDWGYVGGDLVELLLKNTHFLVGLGAMDDLDTKMGVETTPPGTTPVKYLGTEIVLSDWSARLWSLYYFDWAARPLYKVPMTVGFAKGVTNVHRKMEDEFKKKHRPITIKPFLCITSRGDDVLKAEETLNRTDWIGPSRWEIELNDNGHDVFLSYDANDTQMAIDMCLVWMKNRRFAG
jgi:alpha-beta hydrolase superfamily lysophospholipase